jgi:hypothetical protein
MMPTYGQELQYDGGSTWIGGCASPDQALWRALQCTGSSRKAAWKRMTKQQRDDVLRIARAKLST